MSLIFKFVFSSTANQPASTESGVESAISTPIKNGVLPLESSMESKIKQFEDEMSTFLEDSAERANIDDKIYSSQFLYFMQKIVAVRSFLHNLHF